MSENDPYLPLSNAQVTRAFLSIMFTEWTVDELSYAHIEQQAAIQWMDDLMKEMDENS